MWHSRGSRLPFRKLQDPQAVTTFSQDVRPPLARGTTWSNVSSGAGRLASQYWQVNPSRRKTLNRVNAGIRAEGIKSRSAMTEGSRIEKLGERTSRSYSESTETRSRNTAFTASCQFQVDNGK
jgi:hypothetical protein